MFTIYFQSKTSRTVLLLDFSSPRISNSSNSTYHSVPCCDLSPIPQSSASHLARANHEARSKVSTELQSSNEREFHPSTSHCSLPIPRIHPLYSSMVRQSFQDVQEQLFESFEVCRLRDTASPDCRGLQTARWRSLEGTQGNRMHKPLRLRKTERKRKENVK